MWSAHTLGDRLQDHAGAITGLGQTFVALVAFRFSLCLCCVHGNEISPLLRLVSRNAAPSQCDLRPV